FARHGIDRAAGGEHKTDQQENSCFTHYEHLILRTIIILPGTLGPAITTQMNSQQGDTHGTV
ncbi:MAG: hypothetical protein OEU53_05665, partial [Gammaproteobacteria bacterium]|nr:hypothetical protein [Gammaproteobacteria bacterium]